MLSEGGPPFFIKPNLKLKTKTPTRISSAKITEYTSETLEKLEKWFAGPLTIFEKCVKYTKTGILIEVNNMTVEALKEALYREFNTLGLDLMEDSEEPMATLGIEDAKVKLTERFLKK